MGLAQYLCITYTFYMEIFVKEKRDELIWALDHQGLSHIQIGKVFNLDRSTIYRIISNKPRGWKPKWVKAS